MKSWENPKVKVFNVKMDENIADSGNGTQVITLQQSGVIANAWPTNTYKVNGNIIVDSGIEYTWNSGMNRFQTSGYTDAAAVSSCLA